MSLSEILEKRRPALLRRWVDVVVASYPEETARFLHKQKDQFQNPVGHTITVELGEIYDLLAGGKPLEGEIGTFLDRLIRVRALQDFKPSTALGFIFALKWIIRDELARELEEKDLAKQMLELEGEIERLGMMAFDHFVACREHVCQLKADDMRNMYAAVIKRAGIELEPRNLKKPG
jgi:MoxR-like ATPase